MSQFTGPARRKPRSAQETQGTLGTISAAGARRWLHRDVGEGLGTTLRAQWVWRFRLAAADFIGNRGYRPNRALCYG